METGRTRVRAPGFRPARSGGSVAVAAVDLGAASGRVIVGKLRTGRGDHGQLTLHPVHRFRNVPVTDGGTLQWDILALYHGLLAGLAAASRDHRLASVGIDSWGVDYGLLDAAGALIGRPVHYRDKRTAGAVERVLAAIPAAELYSRTGIQQLPINTIYQLSAAAGTEDLKAARTLLLIPDLLAYWLTGQAGAEVTNASTTQLLDVRTRTWAAELIERAGLPLAIFPSLRQPGEVIGRIGPSVALPAAQACRADTDLAHLAGLQVTAVGSHDTASAVAGVPATGNDFAYICCGTWSLVGIEIDQPVLTEASRAANFSNEAGVYGTIRYLRNVMGLWLLQECLRAWDHAGERPSLKTLLADAARLAPLRLVIDPDDPALLAPGDMPARVAGACRAAGQSVPASPAETVRCILDSLALAHRQAIVEVQRLSGRQVATIHLVGGGARNRLLCQLTADACGVQVVAGPAEATAVGNVLIQAASLGTAPDDLAGMRALIRASQPLVRFSPAGDVRAWRSAAVRQQAVSGRPGPLD
jgi:rhamnulokinase